MGLNPYVWGADNVCDVVTVTRLFLSDDPAKHAEAREITREATDRFNAKGQPADQPDSNGGR
ncbi:hypothetical protein [Streptomyces lasiicapitis]|uniref:hypothetical protein n=1 Tax=Streptomyces lasiicapitis TaxID=1923961 RepID=UPI00369FE5E2